MAILVSENEIPIRVILPSLVPNKPRPSNGLRCLHPVDIIVDVWC